MAFYFSQLSGHKLLSMDYLLIFIAVFCVYSADHIIDAWSIKKQASTFRHRFFQQNLFVMIVLTMILILADIIIAYCTLSNLIFKNGIFLSGIILIYYILNYFSFRLNLRNFFKEFLAAIIYTGGVMLPSFSRSLVTESLLVISFQIFLTAFLNLVIFSYFDHDSDKADKYNSIVILLGKGKALALIYILIILQIIIFIVTLIQNNIGVYFLVIPLLMTLILFNLFYFRKYFSINYRYRYAGDSIFFIPLLLLLK